MIYNSKITIESNLKYIGNIETTRSFLISGGNYDRLNPIYYSGVSLQNGDILIGYGLAGGYNGSICLVNLSEYTRSANNLSVYRK